VAHAAAVNYRKWTATKPPTHTTQTFRCTLARKMALLQWKYNTGIFMSNSG